MQPLALVGVADRIPLDDLVLRRHRCAGWQFTPLNRADDLPAYLVILGRAVFVSGHGVASGFPPPLTDLALPLSRSAPRDSPIERRNWIDRRPAGLDPN